VAHGFSRGGVESSFAGTPRPLIHYVYGHTSVDHATRRGGSFYSGGVSTLHAAYRHVYNLSIENRDFGFRVAEVSEQAPIPTVSEWGVVTMALLVLTAGTLVYARRGAAMV